jgi:hypothetical protein
MDAIDGSIKCGDILRYVERGLLVSRIYANDSDLLFPQASAECGQNNAVEVRNI